VVVFISHSSEKRRPQVHGGTCKITAQHGFWSRQSVGMRGDPTGVSDEKNSHRWICSDASLRKRSELDEICSLVFLIRVGQSSVHDVLLTRLLTFARIRSTGGWYQKPHLLILLSREKQWRMYNKMKSYLVTRGSIQKQWRNNDKEEKTR
jgi:hypothetical protein